LSNGRATAPAGTGPVLPARHERGAGVPRRSWRSRYTAWAL